MADVDDLARRTTALVMDLARRGMLLAVGVALVTFIIGGLSYLTGLAALDGSARSAWTFVGAVMLVVAVGAPLLAAWRLSRVSKRAGALVAEFATLIRGNPDAQRVVIETVTVDQSGGAGTLTPAVIETRQFSRLRQVSLTAADVPLVAVALRAVTTFPLLLVVSIVLMLVFGVLGFLFLIAWIV